MGKGGEPMKYNPFVPNGIAYPGMFIGRLEEIEEIELGSGLIANR
jgi:hypothetical protein